MSNTVEVKIQSRSGKSKMGPWSTNGQDWAKWMFPAEQGLEEVCKFSSTEKVKL